MGYATQIWAPQSIELIVNLERIQIRATKFILKLPYSSNISYTSRLETLNLISICYWHELFFQIDTRSCSVLPEVRKYGRRTRGDREALTESTLKMHTEEGSLFDDNKKYPAVLSFEFVIYFTLYLTTRKVLIKN